MKTWAVVAVGLLICVSVLVSVIVSNRITPDELHLERAFNAKLHYVFLLDDMDDLQQAYEMEYRMVSLCGKYFNEMKEELDYCTFPNSYRDAILVKLRSLIDKISRLKTQDEWRARSIEKTCDAGKELLVAIKEYDGPAIIKQTFSEMHDRATK